MVGTRNVPRAPSRTSNRLSTVFGRLRDGPQNRPKSQTSSTILSPFDKDPVAVDGDIQRLPVMMSPTETDVAPWTVPDEVGIKTPNMHRIGLNGRIGFLPSPAVETQMTLEQQDETEHGAVMQEVQQEAKQESQQDIQQKSQLDIQPEDAPEHNQSEVDARDSANSSTATRVGQGEAIKAINKSTIAVETSEARLSADSHRVSYCSEPSLQQHDEQSRFSEPTMVEPPTATDPLQPIVKPMGSVLRSPAARPSRFSDAYYLIDTKNLATEPTFSPVSSLGPDAEDEIDNRKKEDGNYLDGMVSPVDEGEIQPMEKPVVSVPANVEEEAREHHNTSHDQQPYTELNSVAPQQRPITERKMSRSSLPSQQRPVESPKRINWNPPRSRRASQVLEPATEGVVTPHFGSRKNSINGLGDFQINSGSYFTSDDISAATASNLSSDFQGPVDGTSGMSSSSWGQRVGQASPLPMEDTARGPWPNPQQHYGCLQQPASVNDLPPQEFTSQHYTYAQQPVTAGAPPPVRREDLQSNRFTPATFDPKQQSAEHSYVGEQSPPQNRLYRRTYPGANCNSGPQSQAESKFSVDAARTNPSTVTNQQQPFASDKMSQATLQEQKEKRRSGFFGAFSRSSSVSESSRLSSRGNTTATAADTSASKQPPQSQGYANPAISASQEARENTDSRDNILNKLGRSATTASMQDPEKKEKRFSRLGSIFGRRNSKAGRPPPVVKPQPPPEAKKPNRLVKPMPISHSQSQSRKSASSTPVQRSRESLPIRSTTRPTGQGDVLSPQSPPPGLQAMYQYQSGCQPGAAELTQLPAAWSAPPPGGWYAPSGRPSSYTESERQQGKKREPTLPVVQPTGAGYSSPQQTTRRLHSEGFRREPRYMTASPGPGSVTNNAAAPRERYYASGGQAIPPGTVMADRVDTGWEQTMPPMIASHLATSGSAPRDIQRTNGQRRLSGSWQHQSSYGSDAGGAGPHLDNFSLYGTSPNSRRHGSIGSDARMPNLTPTHSRTASFGAAPKDVYRMSSTFEGEQTLQRNFEQIIMQAQEGVMYGPNGGNCAYATDPSVNDGRTSANSSPYRSRGEAGGRYMQQQYLQRSNTSGAGVFLPMPPARTLSGNWQQFAAPGPGSPVGSLRQSRTPNESRAGSRTNSLVIIDEDHPFPDQSHAPSAPPISATSAPAPVSIPASSPAQNVKTWGSQQGYASRQPPPQIQSFSPGGRSYNRMWSPQQTQSQQQQQQQQPPTPQSQYMNYNANFERRRAERRGSGAYTQHAREQHTVEQVGEPTQMENPNHSGHL
ncbi:hypothetical protein BDV97DRAFT_402496 [Delphinella strobiligena]|nr:hypothetical protein BDV97DRAFT_402496 [Delphinella strobiligena]